MRAAAKHLQLGGQCDLLELLFPGGQPTKRARPWPAPRLPNDAFSIVARYYGGRAGEQVAAEAAGRI